jgi:DNA mismatch repair protein MutS
MAQKIKLLIFLTLFFQNILAGIDQAPQPTKNNENKTLYFWEELSNLNLKSFKTERESFSANTFEEYLTYLLNTILNPKDFAKRELAFNIFKETDKKSENKKTTTKNEIRTWQDLNLFCGQSCAEKYVASSIDRTQTEIGKVAVCELLTTLTTNTNILQKRQALIKTLVDDEVLLKKLAQAFADLKTSENILLSFFDQFGLGDLKQTAAQINNFSIPILDKKLNNSANALLLKNCFSHLENAQSLLYTTIASAVLISYGISYGILYATGSIDFSKKIKDYLPEKVQNFLKEEKYWGSTGPILSWLCEIDVKWLHSSILLVGGIYCALSIKHQYKWEKEVFLFEKTMHTIMHQLSKFIRASQDIYELIKNYPALKNFEEFQDFINFFEKEIYVSNDLKDFFSLCRSSTLSSEPSFFSHRGKVIRSFMLMYEIKNKIYKMLMGMGKIDAYCSFARLYKEFENEKIKFAFAKFTQAERPFIKLKNFWHPLIDKEKVIANSITLGTENERSNMILTGPNAGGKSITLKSIFLCLWLSQTIGIAPASEIEFTPFTSLVSYLNITDDIGAGQSLFKAEVIRCQELLDKIEKSAKNEFHLQIFDEIFNGTTPAEGCAAADGVADYLSSFKNNICLLATHFVELTNLATKTATFDNYKVSVVINPDGSLNYPYKLEKGISDQHVAFDILKNQGFAGSIIENAQRVLRK